jgi:very-long-chain (3R)-3-hydroxyacyl-CoA dehydratase
VFCCVVVVCHSGLIGSHTGPPFIIRIYLILYNVISCLGWGYVLVHTVTHLTGYDFKHFKLPVSETPSPVEVKLHEAQDIAHRLLALLVKYIPFLSPFVSTETKIRAQVPNDFQALWGRAASTFVEVYPQTKIVQTAAALEIVHSLFGFVRSPLLTTIMQVASRLQLVWGIAERFPSVGFTSAP